MDTAARTPPFGIRTAIALLAGIGACLLLPWLLARTALRLSQQLKSWFWRLLWQLAAVGGYFGACISSGLALVGLVYLLVQLLD